MDRCFRLDVLGQSISQQTRRIGPRSAPYLAFPSQAFALYAPIFLKSLHSQQRTLKRDILRNKAELQATSSQDQFAKWAKLRRRLDKGLSDLETISSLHPCLSSRNPDLPTRNLPCPLCAILDATVASHRAQFDRVFSTLLYVITSGLQWAIVWWYRREPAFWMPAGWVPRGMDRWLSFGGGPRGEFIPSRSKPKR